MFRSLYGGRNWRTLNSNKSLHPQATDVQAVLAVSEQVILAGTWKHGLYVSRNNGGNFKQIIPFPSSDVRDLQMAGGVIYAATARHGVHASMDVGRSWKPLGPGDDFLWLVTIAGKRLFASSPEKAVYERPLTSGEWRKIFVADGANAVAITPGSGGLRAVASSKGLHILPMTNVLSRASGDTALIAAVLRDDLEAVKRLIATGIRVDRVGASRNTALIFAARDGQTDIARLLLDAGAEPGWIDGEKVTPLILASFKNHPEIVRLLLAKDSAARLNHADKSGRTALDYASQRGTEDAIYKLLTR